MTDQSERIAYLKKRRDELQQRLSAIKDEYGKGLSADFGEQAVELENAEVLAEISRVAATELEHVEQQLRQLGVT